MHSWDETSDVIDVSFQCLMSALITWQELAKGIDVSQFISRHPTIQEKGSRPPDFLYQLPDS